MAEKFVVNTAPIDEMLEKLTVESVFGKPTTENKVTIIPVAQVAFGFGYGGGYGRGPNGKPTENSEKESTGEGGGTGGGGGGRTIPRGYLHITADGVKYEPIIDSTRIPLAGIVMLAWSIFWITATIRTIAKAVAKRKKA